MEESVACKGCSLAIVGSRDPFDEHTAAYSAAAVARATEIITAMISEHEPIEVVSGGARGIDSLAAQLGLGHHVQVKEFLPATARWHDGYKPRNDRIAESCDALVRIAATTTTTKGSLYTMQQAIRQGKPVEEFILNPEGEVITTRTWEAE